jgi:tripartite-type tricarboxylate transporter receptor subunit TctC
MKRPGYGVAFCCGALLLAIASEAWAQNYPVRPVRLVVGSGQDVIPRMVGEKLSGMWGQQVVVDPRAGAGGLIAEEIVARAAPDGYTWLLSTAVYTIHAGLFPKPPFHIVNDFAPVTLIGTATFLLTLNPSVPAKSVAELIRLAREKPGQITYASSGVGTPPHLAGEMLKSMARIDLLHVPYKSVAASIPDLLSGRVQTSFIFAPTVLALVKSGKLRALAVTSARRSEIAPDLPTMAESGLPGYEVVGWNGIHAPKRTPQAIIDKISADALTVIRLPDVRERLNAMGFEAAETTVQQFDAFTKTDVARWTKVVKEAGIKPE